MSFINTLNQSDRDTLRVVVMRTHMKHHPKNFITNYEADRIIEAIGPEIAERMIRVGKNYDIINR